jgi:hypothetical protein
MRAIAGLGLAMMMTMMGMGAASPQSTLYATPQPATYAMAMNKAWFAPIHGSVGCERAGGGPWIWARNQRSLAQVETSVDRLVEVGPNLLDAEVMFMTRRREVATLSTSSARCEAIHRAAGNRFIATN